MYINESERDNLNKGLSLFIEALRPYLVSVLENRYGNNWSEEFSKTLKEKQSHNWNSDLRKGISPQYLIDFQYLKQIALDNKELGLKDDFGYERYNLATWFSEIYEARNSIRHDSPLEEDKAAKAWIHPKNNS